jgi:predicted O-linked N-acetylglucosamine transferase (SPINDLY family)
MSASALRKLHQARNRLQNGDVAGAAFLCEEVLQRLPNNPDALWLLGSIRVMSGQPKDAAALLEKLVALVPDHGAALEGLGLAYLIMKEHATAERVLRKALVIPGAPPSVRMRLGIALLHQGQHGNAITELERTVKVEPGNVDAYLNLGQAYAASGDVAVAARQFEHVLALDPGHGDALYNLGVVSLEQGLCDRAQSCFERLLAQSPAYVDARERLAAMLLGVGRFREAITHLREIVRVQPAKTSALTVLANAYFECGELDEAESTATRARELDPVQAGAYGILAQVHYLRAEFDTAAKTLQEGYERSGSHALLGTLVHLLHRMCDWRKWHAAWERLARALDQSSDCGTPFYLLCENTTAQQQLAYTQNWAATRFGSAPARPAAVHTRRSNGSRVRVGYFSPDFHEHATAYLLAEVLERHDRERFEIYAYSYGPEDHSAMRGRLRSAVEHFVDVAWDPDDVIVERMRSDTLDVLVDLKGYTMGDRLNVLAQRPCPIQVTWLGYPGTCGASFIDYVIADAFVIPTYAEPLYSEKVLRLPHCYQPNDRKRPIGQPLGRTEYGVPEDAFVFCCFNQTVKITPEVMVRWVNLLASVPGSVLWLLEDNRWATDNLHSSFAAAGIDPARLISAPRLPLSEHLARYRVADLALDTFPYTSHTTASDALWMGCPLVALCGQTFTSRVSGSILSNAGLPELVTDSFDSYEQLAHRFATDPALMRDVRARLAAARDTAPLFDSEKFTRDLEQLYLGL